MNLLLLFFLIGAASDLVLQQLNGYYIDLLKPYWATYGTWMGAFLAGVTTMLGGALVVLLTERLFEVQRGQSQYVMYGALTALTIGFIIDLVLNWTRIFPSLKTWYRTLGATEAAMWGSAALLFVFLLGTYLN